MAATTETTEQMPRGMSFVQSCKALTVCLSYMSVSILIIRYNKHIMKPEVFPFALALSSMHMFGSWVLCGALYCFKPSLFPGFVAAKDDRWNQVKSFLPLIVFFAVTLICSNLAYFYAEVSFLQFVKETNVVTVFILSCALGLQTMSRARMATILWIVGAATLTITSGVSFVWTGFLIQLVGSISESTRVTLSERLLTGKQKIDPLSYLFVTAPFCLAILLCGLTLNWSPEIVPAFIQNWRILLPNVLVAFCLNLLVPQLIQMTSATGCVLCGLLKDLGIVIISARYFGEVVLLQQYLAFIAVILGIFWWSFMKVSPEHAAVKVFERAVCTPVAGKGEESHLLDSTKAV